jgi:SAM-dependent methyltransferase
MSNIPPQGGYLAKRCPQAVQLDVLRPCEPLPDSLLMTMLAQDGRNFESVIFELLAEARFLVADALRLIDLGELFDTVLDCGLFHVLDDDERECYVDSLAAVVPPGGRYHMLCFSDGQPGDWDRAG